MDTVCGRLSRIRLTTSKPDMSGMLMSISTMSGLISKVKFSALMPSMASPRMAYPFFSQSNRFFSPWSTVISSSIIRTVILRTPGAPP